MEKWNIKVDRSYCLYKEWPCLPEDPMICNHKDNKTDQCIQEEDCPMKIEALKCSACGSELITRVCCDNCGDYVERTD